MASIEYPHGEMWSTDTFWGILKLLPASPRGASFKPMKCYYTKEGLMERIREIDEICSIFGDRKAELINLYTAVRDTEDCVVDDMGKAIKLGKAKKISWYAKGKTRQGIVSRYRAATREEVGYKRSLIYPSRMV